MTNEGKMYAAGAVVILALGLLLLFWSVLLWVGIGLAVITLLILGWLVWGVIHRRRTEQRLDRAEARKAEAEAAQQEAIAARLRAEAAQAAALVHAIPANYAGLMLDSPADKERLATWAQPKKVIYQGAPEPPALPAPAPTGALLPQAHVWEVIEPEVGPNRFYLGATVDDQGRNTAVWVPLDGVITLVSIGPQGLGKTTLARSLALQQVMQGGDVAICDWFNDIAAEMGQFFPHCYSEPEDCEAYVVDVLNPEMARCREEWKAGKRDFPAKLWIIDEWAMLRKDCPAMAEALTNAFSFWRKLGLRTVVSSVALNTNELGISKSAVSTLALFSGNENLARTWGISGVKAQLDLLYKSGRGYCLITSQHLQRQAELLALPNVSPDLFQAVIQRTRRDLFDHSLASAAGIPPLPALPMKREAGESGESARIVPIRPSPDSSSLKSAKMALTKWEREFIKVRYRKGAQRTEIRDELRQMRPDGFDNRLWPELKAICDEIDREEAQA